MTTPFSEIYSSITLNALGNFRNGVNFSRAEKGKGLHIINVKDIYTDIPIIEFNTLDRVDLSNKRNIKVYYVQEGDLFFVRSSVKRDGIGYVSMANANDNNTVHCGFVIRLRLKEGSTSPKFLVYLLRSPEYRLKITNLSSGSAITNITQDSLGSLEIVLPPLGIQNGIASILSAYDNFIENNSRCIEILEEMAREIYREWFVHFRFQGHKEVEMVDSELGAIPEGWKTGQLEDIAEEVRRNTNPSDLPPDTPYIGLAEIPRRSIALPDWGKASDAGSTKLQFKKGEILFGKIRPYFHKVVVAPVDGICSCDTIVIVPKTSDMFALTLSVVNSDYFVAHATASSKGVKMPRADWNVLVNYPIIIPEFSVLKKFNLFVENSLDLIQTLSS